MKYIERKPNYSHKDPVKWIEANATDPLTEKPIKLLPFQRKLIRNMFSKEAKILCPSLFMGFSKKSGKSALAALILGYRMNMIGRNEFYAIFSGNENQSFVVYRSFIELFRKHHSLRT